MSTKIIAVINADGTNATAAEIWQQPNALLFEITEGPHAGKRGPDAEIFDLVGSIEWDTGEVSVRETGQRIPAWMCPRE